MTGAIETRANIEIGHRNDINSKQLFPGVGLCDFIFIEPQAF